MIRFIIGILMLLVASPAWAGFGMVVDAGGGVAAVTAFGISQNFEGTGYDNSETWSESGTVDEDYTTTALRGSQSFYAGSGANNSTITLSAAQGEVWGHCMFRFTSTYSGDVAQILQLQDASNNQLALFTVQDTSYFPRAYQSGGTGTSISASLSANTTYHLWIHALKGSTSTVEMWVGTTTTRPSDVAESWITFTGTWTADIAKLRIGQGVSSGTGVIIDQVILSDSEFTTVD
jgi:hypothetical protein